MFLTTLNTWKFSLWSAKHVSKETAEQRQTWWESFVKWLLKPISFPFDERDIVDSELKLIEEPKQTPLSDSTSQQNERQPPQS